MEYGLDIGPAAIRAATDDGDGPTIDAVPPVVFPVDDDTLTKAGLSRESDTVQVDGTTYAVGAAARKAAATASRDPQPLFVNGHLAEDGPADATVVLDALIDDVVGDVADGRLCYTTVGAPVETAADTHHEAVTTALADRSVDPTPISKGFAVVYDQLAADNYTGLGVCLETQTTSATVAYYGVPAVAVSIAKGREWVVDRVADETGHEPAQVARTLEDLTLDPDVEAGGLESALVEAYDDLVAELIDAIRDEADENDVQRGLSIPVAIAGEGAIEGLEFLVGGRFDAATVPFSVRDVRLAELPAESAVRGALAAARDDVEADGAMTGAELAGADTASATAASAVEGESATDTELAFDEFDAAGTTPDPADDAIEKLFDRLADRDDEIQSVREDLEYVEARTAAAEDVAALDDRLESFADELAALETKSETHATETDVASLEADLEALSDAFDALEAEVDAVGETITAVEETAADERSALDDRLVELAADLETVTDRTATIDEALDEVRTDLDDLAVTAATEASLETLEGTISELTDDIADLERDSEQRDARLDGVAGRLEELRTRLDGVADRLEEHVERTDARFDAVETTLDEEIDAVDDELDAVRETVDDRIDDVEATFTADLSAIEADLERETDALAETIATIDERVEETERRLDDHVERIDTIKDQLDDDRDRIDETESQLTDQNDRLESLRADYDNLAKTVEARPDESAVERLANRLDATDSRIDDVETQATRDEDLEALRNELEAVRADATATPALPPSIVAGGGGAGVVAGAIAALTGDATVGAGGAVVGLVLIAVASSLAR